MYLPILYIINCLETPQHINRNVLTLNVYFILLLLFKFIIVTYINANQENIHHRTIILLWMVKSVFFFPFIIFVAIELSTIFRDNRKQLKYLDVYLSVSISVYREGMKLSDFLVIVYINILFIVLICYNIMQLSKCKAPLV